MSVALSLSITTPLSIVLREEGVVSIRGEDASGSFGILPGHADFITVIDAAVLRWRHLEGPWRYAVVRGGVFSVSGGNRTEVVCRDAVLGDDLGTLQAEVAAARQERLDSERRARAHSTQLHARAIRHFMRELSATGDAAWLDEEEAR